MRHDREAEYLRLRREKLTAQATAKAEDLRDVIAGLGDGSFLGEWRSALSRQPELFLYLLDLIRFDEPGWVRSFVEFFLRTFQCKYFVCVENWLSTRAAISRSALRFRSAKLGQLIVHLALDVRQIAGRAGMTKTSELSLLFHWVLIIAAG